MTYYICIILRISISIIIYLYNFVETVRADELHDTIKSMIQTYIESNLFSKDNYTMEFNENFINNFIIKTDWSILEDHFFFEDDFLVIILANFHQYIENYTEPSNPFYICIRNILAIAAITQTILYYNCYYITNWINLNTTSGLILLAKEVSLKICKNKITYDELLTIIKKIWEDGL